MQTSLDKKLDNVSQNVIKSLLVARTNQLEMLIRRCCDIRATHKRRMLGILRDRSEFNRAQFDLGRAAEDAFDRSGLE